MGHGVTGSADSIVHRKPAHGSAIEQAAAAVHRGFMTLELSLSVTPVHSDNLGRDSPTSPTCGGR